MRSTVLVIFALLIASSVSQPIIPGLGRSGLEDLVSSEVDILGFLLRLFLGGGGGGATRSQESINPLQLLQLGTSFLRTIGNLENSGNDISSRDDTAQDPRVVNYEQEINRRNQLAGVVRLFSGLLSR